jgi:hypothetical protein
MKAWVALVFTIGLANVGFGLAGEKSFRVTLRVVDDEGKPVPNANARVSFEHVYAKKESERVGASKGVTGADGTVTLGGKTGESSIGYDAELPGYYQTWGLRYGFTGSSMFRWQPWNPTIEVVLKRIRNPVPMYARRVERAPILLDRSIALDLVMGDWLPPHGKGKVADVVFLGILKKVDQDNSDYEMTVSFPNLGDGIQRFRPESENTAMRSPYSAPEEGYQSVLSLKRIRRKGVPDVTDFDPKGGYFLRVRTMLDQDGKVVKALYGKIYGEFFYLSYYLNPDGTRNMEYDSKRNLFAPTSRNESAFGLPMP